MENRINERSVPVSFAQLGLVSDEYEFGKDQRFDRSKPVGREIYTLSLKDCGLVKEDRTEADIQVQRYDRIFFQFVLSFLVQPVCDWISALSRIAPSP
jgi:hypothetical protein